MQNSSKMNIFIIVYKTHVAMKYLTPELSIICHGRTRESHESWLIAWLIPAALQSVSGTIVWTKFTI